ncbi:hypothetical protein AB0N43_22395 [Streptomyces pseudogriseolus]|uniref:hypothetical protein n=1 Tax=Streptomyces pseudogriseolus TaxID=36817 RepID=UPI0034718242
MTTDTVVEPRDAAAEETADAGQRHPRTRPLPAPALTAAGTVAVGLGAWANLWYLPFAAGVAAGLYGARRRPGPVRAAVLALLLGPVPWGALLAVRALRGDAVAGTAHTAAALAGLPASAVVTIVLTLFVPLLQTAAGSWFGRALLRCFPEDTRRQAPERTTEEAS